MWTKLTYYDGTNTTINLNSDNKNLTLYDGTDTAVLSTTGLTFNGDNVLKSTLTSNLNINSNNITNVRKISDISGNYGTIGGSQILVSNGNNIFWRDQYPNKTLSLETITATTVLNTDLLKLSQRQAPPSTPADGQMYLNPDGNIYAYAYPNWKNLTNPDYVTTATLSGYVNSAINDYVGILFIDPSANYVTTTLLTTTLSDYVKFTDLDNTGGGGSVDLSDYVTTGSLTTTLDGYVTGSTLSNNYSSTSFISNNYAPKLLPTFNKLLQGIFLFKKNPSCS